MPTRGELRIPLEERAPKVTTALASLQRTRLRVASCLLPVLKASMLLTLP